MKEANLLCRKHRAFNLPAGTCDGTCTTVQTQTACQKECMKDKDCVGINISKEFGYEGRCDVCNECDGKVCEGTEGASDASGDSDLQTWPVGGMEYYPINGIEISAVDFFNLKTLYIYILVLSLYIYQSIFLKNPAVLALDRTMNTMKVPPVLLTVATLVTMVSGTMENGASLQLQHVRMLQNTNGVPLQVMEQVELLAKLSVRIFE